jgi:hypothetical protein
MNFIIIILNEFRVQAPAYASFDEMMWLQAHSPVKAGETLQSRSTHARHQQTFETSVKLGEFDSELGVIGHEHLVTGLELGVIDLQLAIFGLLVRCYTIQRLDLCSRVRCFTVLLGDPCS